MLQARDLSVEVGGQLTLAGATFSLRAGDKVGLVGRNGAGKTPWPKEGENPAGEFFSHRDLSSMTDCRVPHLATS